ncbi:hypothetical protein TanjilG_32831 [Lupinus angustifolius]|uniref:Uncharacterized protein n=1 Tax=Lupinus angustifolius TaxID=3871 RepID=A0A4P1RSN2_LUPAN|nr:hypothetical protein TanjilG_32831 [Lupinus angustifolius]
MAQIPNLDNAPLNLTSIREQSQKELVNILKHEHGVELRHLSADPVQTDCSKVVYLVRSQPNLMRFICSNIQNDVSKGLQREYHVYFVPRRTVACEKVLEEEKLHQLITIGEYPLYIVPMDEDVLSFELDLAYKECQVDGDTGSLWHIAKAIHKLEFSFGVIPNVRAKGKASVRVADILNRMQTEEPVNSSDTAMPEINTVILLDREFLHVSNGSVELDASIMGLQQEGKKTKVPLNSSDKLFKEIRDLNFEIVVQILRQKATSMKQDYTEMTTTTQSVSELKDFVKKLNSLPEITRHINLAQHLTKFTSKPSFLGKLDMEHTIVESESYDMRELLHSYGFEHIATLNNLEKAGLFKKQETKSNWPTIKRALQLVVEDTDTANPNDISYVFSGYAPLSIRLVQHAIRSGWVADGRRALVLVVFVGGVTFAEISALRFLSAQETKSNWPTIKRALQLVVEDTDTANPNDISYVFSGYAPLSIRLVQHAIRSGWRPVEEILKLLPGPHLETKRGGFSNSPSFDTLSGASTSIAKVADGRRALVLVVFVGGVTFAEISALRFLSAQEGMAYDLIIATTKIVNGQTLIETFMEKGGEFISVDEIMPNQCYA